MRVRVWNGGGHLSVRVRVRNGGGHIFLLELGYGTRVDIFP